MLAVDLGTVYIVLRECLLVWLDPFY